jgi:DNA-binding NtrC family response regulator
MVAQGSFTERVVMQDIGEFSELVTSFNAIAAQLEADASIRRVFYQEFETQVAERTKALQAANQELQRELVDAVITDLVMGQMSGLELLNFLRDRNMETILIIMTAYSTIESAVEAMRRGAWDYIPKPIDVEKLGLLIRQGVTNAQLRVENRALKQQLRERFSPHSVLGKSPAIQRLLAQIELIARTEATAPAMPSA